MRNTFDLPMVVAVAIAGSVVVGRLAALRPSFHNL